MRTVSFQNILRGICDQLGWDADNLDADEFGRIKRAVTASLEEITAATWWSDLLKTEQIQFADPWEVATAYAVGDFVYYAPEQAYFQCVRAHAGQAPSTAGITSLAYWSEADLAWDADQYDAAAAYVAGDVVMFTDGNFYHCHTASTGNAPTDTSYWGMLTAWVPTYTLTGSGRVAIGHIKGLYKEDPRKWRFPDRISFSRSPDGITPLQEAMTPRPWLSYLPIHHTFDGDTFDATATYSAAADDERSAA